MPAEVVLVDLGELLELFLSVLLFLGAFVHQWKILARESFIFSVKFSETLVVAVLGYAIARRPCVACQPLQGEGRDLEF